MREFHNLDFLRATAVLLVLIDHTTKTFGHATFLRADIDWLGRFGVLLFFVHTSCVLMMSLGRLRATSLAGPSLYAAFYARRFFRFYPLSAVCVALVTTLAIPCALIQDGVFKLFRPTLFQFMSNLLLVQNLTAGTPDVLSVLWSLPIEVQMYFVLPFIFTSLPLRGRLRWLIVLWLGSIGLAVLQPHIDWRLNLARFFPCFVPGVIAYVGFADWRQEFAGAWFPVFLVALTCLFMLVPGWRAGWFFCLGMGIMLPLFRELTNGFLNRATHEIAKYSYGLYLTHVVCLWLAFVRLSFLPLYMRWIVFIGSILVASVAGYHLIEHPMIRVGTRVADNLAKTTSRLVAVSANLLC